MTNFDRITETPEKLAEFIDSYNGDCIAITNGTYCNYVAEEDLVTTDCRQCMIDWLKQEEKT